MSISKNGRYTYTLRVKPRYSLFQAFDIDIPLKENGFQQNEDYVLSTAKNRKSHSLSLSTLISSSYEESMGYDKKLREKSVDDVSLTKTIDYSYGNSTNDEIESMKQQEKHLTFEMARMEHYTTRTKDEILSIKSEIEAIEPTNRPAKLEELHNALAKRKLKLIEHMKEVNKRRTKLEKHRAKRINCENEIKTVRNKTDTLERHKNHENALKNHFKEPVRHDIKLLEQHTERIRGELQLLKDGYQSIKSLDLGRIKNVKKRLDHGSKFDIFNWDQMAQQYEQLKKSDKYTSAPDIHQRTSVDHHKETKQFHLNATIYKHVFINQAKYDIILSYTNQNIETIEFIKKASPEWFSIHVKDNHSSTNIKTCLDSTSTAVIAVINTAYELNANSQADMTHIFKRQFPLVLIIPDEKYQPSANWLTIVWHAPNTQKIFLNVSDFEEKLRTAISDARWNLSTNSNIPKITRSITNNNRSSRFLGNLYEWTLAYREPARVSERYRQLINDPLRIDTNIKLQDIYYNYIRLYFENFDAMKLFEEGANQNDICKFIQAYAHAGPFSAAFNRHLATHIFYYFGPTLHDNVDYQLVKSLIDFVALCTYRPELSQYRFTGTAYRGIVMFEEDLLKLVVGSRIMNTTFLSASKDKNVVEVSFEQNPQKITILCTYMIKNKSYRRTAIDISGLSQFPDEQEVLILPFSAFYVKTIIRSEDSSEPIEIMLVEDDFGLSKNMKLITVRI